MFNVMFVLYERDGLDRDEAQRYWRETHGPLVAKFPGLRRYAQIHAVGAPQGEPAFLGFATLEFDDAAAFEKVMVSPEFAAALADAVNFTDPDRLESAFVEHLPIVG